MVGPIPAPFGGVASYVNGLAGHLHAQGVEVVVLDFYPSRDKTKDGGFSHRTVPLSMKWMRAIWLWVQATFVTGDIVHWHWSQPHRWFVFFGLLTPRRGRKFVVTFHHGDLSALSPRNAIVGYAVRRALGRMEAIAAISPKQKNWFLAVGAEVARVIFIGDPPLGSLPQPDATELPRQVLEWMSLHKKAGNRVIVSSGSATADYGLLESIEILDLLNEQGGQWALLLVLYGASRDPKLERDLRHALRSHPRIRSVDAVTPRAFLAALQLADVYLRPTRVDSYGLTVSEAIEVGTPSVATDVCVRDSRCRVYTAGDVVSAAREVRAAVETDATLIRPVEKPNQLLRLYSKLVAPRL